MQTREKLLCLYENLIETFSIRQTANRSLLLRVCSFALPRFQTLARRSVQFSSFLFSKNIIQYKKTYRNCKVAREPRRNQRAYDAWAPQSQRNKQNKTLYLGVVVLRVRYFEHALLQLKNCHHIKSFTPLVCCTTQLIQYVSIHNKNSVIS